MGLEEKHSWRLSIALGLLLVIASFLSLFIGVIDMTPGELFAGNAEQFQLFLISRLPRLLAILCTGMGMSVAGLIMQQLCMNKFVSPTTGATLASARFGILLALLFLPGSTIMSRALFSFIFAVKKPAQAITGLPFNRSVMLVPAELNLSVLLALSDCHEWRAPTLQWLPAFAVL